MCGEYLIRIHLMIVPLQQFTKIMEIVSSCEINTTGFVEVCLSICSSLMWTHQLPSQIKRRLLTLTLTTLITLWLMANLTFFTIYPNLTLAVLSSGNPARRNKLTDKMIDLIYFKWACKLAIGSIDNVLQLTMLSDKLRAAKRFDVY